jgi:glycosyltransferase involved in cell wall biosynthesis
VNATYVTVLIDTFNYGRFIEEAIESVLSQDFPSDQMEVLVVDDGSTDNTAELVKKYAPRVQYLYKSNGGQGSAFNLGVAKARGEIVAFLDADDYWLPGKLRRVVEEFQKNPGLGMVYHPYLEIDMQSNERRPSKFRPISGSLFENEEEFFWYHPPGTCASFRRKFLEQVLPAPEGLRTQADGYIGALIIFVAPILAIPECLATYRFHGKNLYHAEESQTPVDVLRNRMPMRRILVAAMRKWLAENGFTRKQSPVRSFLDRWTLYQESDEFQLESPKRLHFFRHLLLYNRCYASHMTTRLRVINYVNALGALILGYDRFSLLEKWRTQWADKLGRGRK